MDSPVRPRHSRSRVRICGMCGPMDAVDPVDAVAEQPPGPAPSAYRAYPAYPACFRSIRTSPLSGSPISTNSCGSSSLPATRQYSEASSHSATDKATPGP